MGFIGFSSILFGFFYSSTWSIHMNTSITPINRNADVGRVVLFYIGFMFFLESYPFPFLVILSQSLLFSLSFSFNNGFISFYSFCYSFYSFCYSFCSFYYSSSFYCSSGDSIRMMLYFSLGLCSNLILSNMLCPWQSTGLRSCTL